MSIRTNCEDKNDLVEAVQVIKPICDDEDDVQTHVGLVGVPDIEPEPDGLQFAQGDEYGNDNAGDGDGSKEHGNNNAGNGEGATADNMEGVILKPAYIYDGEDMKTVWKRGDNCGAIYEEDGVCYPAEVIQIHEWNNTYIVRFYGYGNEEEIPF